MTQRVEKRLAEWQPISLTLRVIKRDPINTIMKTSPNTLSEFPLDKLDKIKDKKMHTSKGPHKSQSHKSLLLSSFFNGIKTNYNFKPTFFKSLHFYFIILLLLFIFIYYECFAYWFF